MPNRPRPVNWGVPPPGDGDLDELAHSLRGVDDIVAALRARPWHADLAGETRALAEFRRVHRRPRHRRRGRMVPATRFAAAAALVAVAACGAAAETGRLPRPIQNLAHVVFAAPTPVHTKRPAPQPRPSRDADPGAGWSSACQSYKTELAAGRKPWLEPGYRALVSAAGGAAHVTDYCSDGDFPGTSYPGAIPQDGADQRLGSWANGRRTSDSSQNPASGASGDRTGATGPGSGPGPGGGTGGRAGTGGGASSGGTTGSGSDPVSGPAHHYPGAGN